MNHPKTNLLQTHANDSRLLEDTQLAFEKLARQEVKLTEETEELFKKQVEHIRSIDKLQNSIPNIKIVDDESQKLSSLLDSSSTLVEEVCSKVRRIDLAKARLEDCLLKIVDILDLGTCRNGVHKAMEINNYEEAAMHIKRFLSIDQEELVKTVNIICDHRLSRHPVSSTIAHTISPASSNETDATDDIALDSDSMNQAFHDLLKARDKLMNICQENFAHAIEENNPRDIDRYFKLFPLLNKHQDGLQRYAEYLRSKIVSEQLDETLRSLHINQADKLAALYETMAKIIDAHQPIVETYYGPGHLMVVIRIIQDECDRLSRGVFVEFRDATKLQSVARTARSSTLQSTGSMSSLSLMNQSVQLTPSKLDPRTVDVILNELSIIISRSEVYLNFLVQRVRDDFGLRAENEDQRRTNLMQLYKFISLECELNHRVQELGGIYVMLERFYLEESSKRAIIMDQIVIESSSCFLSSMLDDIFFVIKRCTKRALSTKSNEVFCAIINHCVTLLDTLFCQTLEERLRNQQYFSNAFTAKNLGLRQAYKKISSGRYLRSTSEQQNDKSHYFAALNNLDRACDYIRTLREILGEAAKKLRPSTLMQEQKPDNEINKSISQLDELFQLVNKFSSIVNTSLYELFNVSLKTRSKTMLQTIISEDPDLVRTLIDDSNSTELTSLAKSVLNSTDDFIESSLTPENYSKLVVISREFLISSLNSR